MLICTPQMLHLLTCKPMLCCLFVNYRLLLVCKLLFCCLFAASSLLVVVTMCRSGNVYCELQTAVGKYRETVAQGSCMLVTCPSLHPDMIYLVSALFVLDSCIVRLQQRCGYAGKLV